MPKARVQKRLYYKIGEACKALGIQPYVLRYWETEFPALSPSKSRSGQRVYSERELEIIRRIKVLLYDEGYTIAGAKKKLEAELAGGAHPEPVELAEPPSSVSPLQKDAFNAVEPVPDRQRSSAAASAKGGAAGPLETPISTPAAASGRSVRRAPSVADLPLRHSAGLVPEDPPPADPLATAIPLPLPWATPSIGAGEPAPEAPAEALPATLDREAAQQIERLRTGIHKALQEAREILALLDSRSP